MERAWGRLSFEYNCADDGADERRAGVDAGESDGGRGGRTSDASDVVEHECVDARRGGARGEWGEFDDAVEWEFFVEESAAVARGAAVTAGAEERDER